MEMKSKVRSIAERHGAMNRLWYEVKMYIETSNRLIKLEKANKPIKGVREHAYLETFLLHVRNLCEFFLKGQGGSKIKCRDFIKNFSQGSIKLPKGNNEKDINNYLSHMTWYGIKYDNPDWKIESMTEKISMCLKVFFEELENENYPTEGPRQKNNFKKLLKKIGIQI